MSTRNLSDAKEHQRRRHVQRHLLCPRGTVQGRRHSLHTLLPHQVRTLGRSTQGSIGHASLFPPISTTRSGAQTATSPTQASFTPPSSSTQHCHRSCGVSIGALTRTSLLPSHPPSVPTPQPRVCMALPCCSHHARFLQDRQKFTETVQRLVAATSADAHREFSSQAPVTEDQIKEAVQHYIGASSMVGASR